METPKEYYYTYYSYEEWGRGYFGSRGCKCLPEEDINYFGSFYDKTFNPKCKIILKDDYSTREEAYVDEIILQEHYKVVENPHFANQSYQTSTKFYYITPTEKAIENGKKGGAKGGQKTYKLRLGIHGRTKEQMSEDSKKGAQKAKELGVGIQGWSKEQSIENGKKSGKRAYELGVGIHSLTKEERSAAGKRGIKATLSQKWMCLETGYTTNPGALTTYQKARGIDTSKRKRIA